MLFRTCAAALALALLLVAPAGVRADDPAPVCTEDPSDAEVVRRTRWIEARFEEVEPQTRWWFGGFATLHVLLTVIQTTMAFAAPDNESRIDPIVNSIGGLLGGVTLLIATPPMLGATEAMAGMPRGTRAERLIAMRAAESRLRRSSEAASFVRGPLAATGSALYVDAASITLIALGRTTAGYIHAGGGTLLGLGRIFLHPTGAIDAWARYHAAHPEAGCEPPIPTAPAPSVALAPAIGPSQVGLGLTVSF